MQTLEVLNLRMALHDLHRRLNLTVLAKCAIRIGFTDSATARKTECDRTPQLPGQPYSSSLG